MSVRTALYIATTDEIKAMLPRIAGAVVWARNPDDREWRWTSPSVGGVVLQEPS